MMQAAWTRIGFSAAFAVLFVLMVSIGRAAIPPLSESLKNEAFGLEEAEFGMGLTELRSDGARGETRLRPEAGKQAFCVEPFNIRLCIGKGLRMNGAAVAK